MSATVNPHACKYGPWRVSDNIVVRSCLTCQKRQFAPREVVAGEGVPIFGTRAEAIKAIERVAAEEIAKKAREALETRRMESIVLGKFATGQDYGGIVTYDPATDSVGTRFGVSFGLEEIFHMNPAVSRKQILDLVTKLPPPAGTLHADAGASPSQISQISAQATKAGMSMHELAESLGYISPPHPTTIPVEEAVALGIISAVEIQDIIYREVKRLSPFNGDTALGLILDEVRLSDDPFKASGEWLTKITRELTRIASEEMNDEP